MPRGGKRKGAGRKSSWKHKDTQLIRVPKGLASKILQYAHELDERTPVLKPVARKVVIKQMPLLANSVHEFNELPPMTLTDLSRRLRRHKTTLVGARKRGVEYFSNWSREKDPDGVEWEYCEADQLFRPVIF